ncbi:hypothetical protein EVJ20_03395 [Exiguobacterium sp. SH0S1]|uniref:hypothetical protein n=1 Tax=Exiguobacterium sp. SH0S1 TaxID=2510949 RepID=UPI00103C244E|nr:hypothetical protein [Exiguobacterium sp. SH0S1]TCI80370.1 hypothetical protein EVJ20_03395 [Exiguobacterium sp. SH0S1]
MYIRILGILSFVAWNYILGRQYFFVEGVLIDQDHFIIELIGFETFLFLPFLMMMSVIPLCSAIISEYTIRYFKKRDNPRLLVSLTALYSITTIHLCWYIWSFISG